MNYKEKDLIVFFDSIGHTSVAEFVTETDTTVVVKNPMYLAAIPHRSQEDERRIEVHFETPAWFFRDFMADHNEPFIVTLEKSQFNFANKVELAEIIKLRYYNNFARIVGGAPEQVDASGNPVKVAAVNQPLAEDKPSEENKAK